MNNTYEYYDSVNEISVLTGEAINNMELIRENVRQALYIINSLKEHGNAPISPVSNITINDVHRNLLFFELLLNQTHGVISTFTFQELVEVFCYSSNEEDL
jgi:hypothetical protein